MVKRSLIRAKFNNRCAYCGKTLGDREWECTFDHIVPKSKGGTREENNINPACFGCNQMKKDLSLEEFRQVRGGGLFYFEQKAVYEKELVERARCLCKSNPLQS